MLSSLLKILYHFEQVLTAKFIYLFPS